MKSKAGRRRGSIVFFQNSGLKSGVPSERHTPLVESGMESGEARAGAEAPRDEYRARLERFRSAREHWGRRYRQFGNARLATAAAAVCIAAVALGPGWISAWWLLAPALAFVALAVWHERIDRRLSKAGRGTAYYEQALARVESRWMGAGNAGERFRDPHHIYSGDLDLFGKGSLFELISAARTAVGERILASWLLAPGKLDDVKARQRAVAELRPRLDLREEIALMGDEIRASVDDRLLQKWGEQPPVKFFAGARAIALILAAAALASFVLFWVELAPLAVFLLVLLAEIVFSFALRDSLRRAGAIETPSRELDLLRLILARLENERFASPALEALRESLQTEGLPASPQIQRLERLVHHLESAENDFFKPIAWPLLWVPQFAMAIEQWRARYGRQIAQWIAAAGEFEALCSLASFAYELPDSSFPELTEGGPVFDAAGLVHPLIPRGEAVANDVALGGAMRLWIVSGSNMSG
ncbi:MAG TPA: hypothetical protein VFW83_03630, partial [Bryobacteraceae bacterium]|nr:hypothetical protein [Bryobacteraceae bacterium]